MNKSTTTKARSKRPLKPAATLEQTAEALDRTRSKHDPDPERVLLALLGWQAGIRDEIVRVRSVCGRFRKIKSGDFRPRFEFLERILNGLEAVEDAFDNWPQPRTRNIAELMEEVNLLLPSPDRDEQYRDGAKKGGAA